MPKEQRTFTKEFKLEAVRLVTVSHVKKSFWAGVSFADLDDLNRQALEKSVTLTCNVFLVQFGKKGG